jgi:hypothetical protein
VARLHPLPQAWLLFLICLASATQGSAYQLFGPYDWGGDMVYPKWGDIHAGAPGGTVTWSIMPDGTTIDPAFDDPNISGTSSFNALINGLGAAQAMEAINRVFDRWSSVANIYFQQVPDTGLPFHSEAAAGPPAGGQIRIGAFNFTGDAQFLGAVGYAAPPNGRESLPGDVLFNASNYFQFAAGNEGDLIDFYQPPTYFFHNDFEGLFLHELGHTLGLAHSDVCSVMSVDFDCYKYLNRIPDPDDIAAATFLYGPALKADFDKNNGVRGADLAQWTTNFATPSGADKATGDADGDGAVDGGDLLVWQRELGAGTVVTTAPTAATVPEPATVLLVVLSAAAIAYCRRQGVCVT